MGVQAAIVEPLEFSEGVSHDQNEIIKSYRRSTSWQQSFDHKQAPDPLGGEDGGVVPSGFDSLGGRLPV
jgi:hypothetical protein